MPNGCGNIIKDKLYAGLDIGTNGVRVVVVNDRLKIVYEESLGYETVSPQEGWAEQDPDKIYATCLKLLHQMMSDLKVNNDQLYITFSSVMHSIMVVDSEETPLTPLIIWADTRARGKCRQLEDKYGREMFYDLTYCPLHSTYWPAKILWLKENIEELQDQDQIKYVSIKEYIINRLTGDWKTDYSLASTSGLFNLKKMKYEPKILDILNIREDNLSAVVSTGTSFEFEIDNIKLTGIMGATDGVLANLGTGAIKETDSVVTAGTSSAVRFTSNHPVKDPEGRAWCYILDQDYYVTGEATNGAGLLIKWMAKILGYDDETEMIEENIEKIPYKINDITLIPTMMAERAPNYNEQLRGLFYGLSLNHDCDDIVIALYESIGLFLKMIHDDVRRLTDQHFETIMTGGLGLSSLFTQLMSYLIGEIKYLPGHNQNTAIGAAMMGIKVIKGLSYHDLIKFLPERKSIDVKIDTGFQKYLEDKYQKFYKIYDDYNTKSNQ